MAESATFVWEGTDRQGRSGLGLEAQRSAVADYLDGGNWTMLDTFTEVESEPLHASHYGRNGRT